MSPAPPRIEVRDRRVPGATSTWAAAIWRVRPATTSATRMKDIAPIQNPLSVVVETSHRRRHGFPN